eukprot:RCo050668
MGNGQFLQHAASGLFLDANGNWENGVLILSPFENNLCQKWILSGKGCQVVLKAASHPHRSVTVGGTPKMVQLSGKACPEHWTVVDCSEQRVILQCTKGFLAGPQFSRPYHPCLVVNSWSSSFEILWKLLPEDSPSLWQCCPQPLSGSQCMAPLCGMPLPPSAAISSHGFTSGTRRWCLLYHGQPASGQVSSCTDSGGKLSAPDGKHDRTEAGPSLKGRCRKKREQLISDVVQPSIREDADAAGRLVDPVPASTAPASPLPPATSATPVNGNRITLVKSILVRNGSTLETLYSSHELTFSLEEGMEQTETLYFLVHAPVRNLRSLKTTSKMGVKVHFEELAFGDYSPQAEPHTFQYPARKVPTGMMVRGNYRQVTEFIDDAGPSCPPLTFIFSIVKAKS